MMALRKLDSKYFPVAPCTNLEFKTKDGVIHQGKYDFNEDMARRWFDESGNEYTSDMVDEWRSKDD